MNVKSVRIAVMGGTFFQVMVPLEDIVEFMNTDMVLLEYWCARPKQQ